MSREQTEMHLILTPWGCGCFFLVISLALIILVKDTPVTGQIDSKVQDETIRLQRVVWLCNACVEGWAAVCCCFDEKCMLEMISHDNSVYILVILIVWSNGGACTQSVTYL